MRAARLFGAAFRAASVANWGGDIFIGIVVAFDGAK
jgi:hypothetical protein